MSQLSHALESHGHSRPFQTVGIAIDFLQRFTIGGFFFQGGQPSIDCFHIVASSCDKVRQERLHTLGSGFMLHGGKQQGFDFLHQFGYLVGGYVSRSEVLHEEIHSVEEEVGKSFAER